MALSKREKNLAMVTGALLVLVVAWFMISAVTRPIRDRLAIRQAAVEKVEHQRDRIRAAAKAEQKLEGWRSRALPAGVDVAKSLYKNWLLELTRSAGLKDTKVDPLENRVNRDVYTVLPFSVHSRGTLDELTEFLYGFYSKGYLHRIRHLTVKPREKSSELDLTITIEALSLPEAVCQDTLPDEESVWLASSSLADYDVIGRRNLFAAYRPSPPVVDRPTFDRPSQPAPPATPDFDPAKYAFLTAIVKVDGQPQIWLVARTTGETFTLAEGDEFQLGSLRGTVVEIHQRSAEIELDGQRSLIALGKSLREPTELPQ